ncbi:MATE family efflux transporter [Wenzhouxiangella sp. XN79A]|uniref:MATE family efflux transporter n=1 Tax=Wenzhouxiangella sp. XN79A TaxID=2724193 RepID=UPI00144A5536|nr:MATE family efflux transporter [Wenzhouxiangella sp. XN79A]NKI34491.1 MATE family efflux transporter [Wenzhouxiangella sp. XN79A]
MSQDPQARLILEGSPFRVLVRMAVPAVAVMLMFGLNSVMDAVYIGQLIGEQALAGVSLAFPITQLTLGLGSLGGIGGGVLLSIAIGRGDSDLLRRLPGTCVGIAALLAAGYGVLGVGLAETLVRGMGATGPLEPIAASYLRAHAWGGIASIAGLTLNMLLRGEGKMALAALYMGLGLVANLVLTPLFIAVFDWGVAGAAWATNLGALLGGLLVWLRFARGRASYPVDARYVGVGRALAGRIARLGVPAMISSSMGLVQAAVVFNVLSRIGNEQDIAFFGAAWRVLMFLLTPLFGLMRAFQPVAGINYGAGRWDRVRLHYWVFVAAGLVLVLPIWALLNLFPAEALAIMLPEVVFSDRDLHHFRVLMVVLPALPIVFTALSLLPAVERPGLATGVSVARQLVLYVPVMLLLPRWVGIPGVYYGATAIDLLCAVWLLLIVLTVFRRGPSGPGGGGPSIGPTDPWRAGAPVRG